MVFGYPCGDSMGNCFPYSLEISSGRYLFEAWGSSGQYILSGWGGYTSGILKTPKSLKLYIFVGTAGMFNAFTVSSMPYYYYMPGAATDVRLNVSSKFEWNDKVSLRSRIFIAGGGASGEWPGSKGGNGGGITGTDGVIDCNQNGGTCPQYYSTGGSQTKGGKASNPIWFNNYGYQSGLEGGFGVSTVTSGIDMGGIGGSGYWSGASVHVAGGGGGGSSFISGHPGCIALKSEKSNEPGNSSIHYSGISFTNTRTITGNNDMPLYYSLSAYGKGNGGRGAFRITLLSSYDITDKYENFVMDIFLPSCFMPVISL